MKPTGLEDDKLTYLVVRINNEGHRKVVADWIETRNLRKGSRERSSRPPCGGVD